MHQCWIIDVKFKKKKKKKRGRKFQLKSHRVLWAYIPVRNYKVGILSALEPTRGPKHNNEQQFSTNYSLRFRPGDKLSQKTDVLNPLAAAKKAKDFQSDTNGFKSTSLTTLTTVNTLLSICCIVLSVIMLHFRIKAHGTKAMGLVQIIYLKNGLADFFVGLGVLLQSPILYLMIWQGREISYITVPVYISYFLTAIGVKMSMFMNCVLGVVRCINIVQPFYQMNKRTITMCTNAYMTIWMVIVGLDLWQFTEKIEKINQVRIVKALVMKGQPGFGLVLLTMKKEQYVPSYFAFHLGNLVQFILPTALPAVLCFVLMIVQLCHRRKKSGGRELRQGQKMARQANDSISKARLTIFLLTNIYVSTSAESIITRLTLHGRKVYLGSKATYEDLLKSAETTQKWWPNYDPAKTRAFKKKSVSISENSSKAQVWLISQRWWIACFLSAAMAPTLCCDNACIPKLFRWWRTDRWRDCGLT